MNTSLPTQPQPESKCNSNATLDPIVITTTTTTTTAASTTETTAPQTRIPTDYDHPNADPVTLTTGIVVSLIVVAAVFNTLIVLLTIYMKKRARRFNGMDTFMENSEADNEVRYVANPHLNKLSTSTNVAYVSNEVD